MARSAAGVVARGRAGRGTAGVGVGVGVGVGLARRRVARGAASAEPGPEAEGGAGGPGEEVETQALPENFCIIEGGRDAVKDFAAMQADGERPARERRDRDARLTHARGRFLPQRSS